MATICRGEWEVIVVLTYAALIDRIASDCGGIEILQHDMFTMPANKILTAVPPMAADVVPIAADAVPASASAAISLAKRLRGRADRPDRARSWRDQ